MRYAQVAGGQKLHLVCEPGEKLRGEWIPAGRISLPLCNRSVPRGYRMTINVPLANACHNCLRVYRAGHFTEVSP